MTTEPHIVRADQATITTATVNIHVIRIGAKQMTLAVFRQLPYDDEITDSASMWGTVNYHTECPGHLAEHRHVVWQRGAELCQAIVRPPEPWRGDFRDLEAIYNGELAFWNRVLALPQLFIARLLDVLLAAGTISRTADGSLIVASFLPPPAKAA